ncbi:MAG: phosphate butyryltransferase [Anaerovoracaceae bacterium]|jgi:phosphate butyryltransferase
MIKTFGDILNEVKRWGPSTITLAVAQEENLLKAVNEAKNCGIADTILVGNKVEIESLAMRIGMDLKGFEIVDVEDKEEASIKAVELVKKGEASLPMKGFVDTSVILKAVLNKDLGLKTDKLLSHVGVFEIAGYDRLFVLSDSAMVIAPSLEDKVDIINNAVSVAHALGNPNPKVAILCAVEKVNEKMPATVDAAKLTEMNERGEITGCLIKGPLALDNAVSGDAAIRKGIVHPVAGHADVLITPNIEAGNILNKSMAYFGKADKAGIIMGAKVPVILTSRASSVSSKLNSIALGILVAKKLNEGR